MRAISFIISVMALVALYECKVAKKSLKAEETWNKSFEKALKSKDEVKMRTPHHLPLLPRRRRPLVPFQEPHQRRRLLHRQTRHQLHTRRGQPLRQLHRHLALHRPLRQRCQLGHSRRRVRTQRRLCPHPARLALRARLHLRRCLHHAGVRQVFNFCFYFI